MHLDRLGSVLRDLERKHPRRAVYFGHMKWRGWDVGDRFQACGGGWGPQACAVWKELAKTTALATGELASSVSMRLSQSLSLVLRRENARAVLRRAAGKNRDHAAAAAEAAMDTT